MALTADQIQTLCVSAIVEARRSIREDERAHPLVGAVLVDDVGNVIATSHRGEVAKQHAEFTLLEKVGQTDLSHCTLFITLEPCIKRGVEKIPCAVRVARSGIRKVFIGTLDPDPRITGKGEMYLYYEGISVERFAAPLADELRAENEAFFKRFRAAHFYDPPPPSLYGAEGTNTAAPAKTRDGALHQSLDLISGSSGEIWISAGDLSWLRELQVALLAAALDRRQVRLLRHRRTEDGHGLDLSTVATRLGISVVERIPPSSVRFTMVAPRSRSFAAIAIERSGALLLRVPEQERLLDVLADWFENNWDRGSVQPAEEIALAELDFESVEAALREYVTRYRGLEIMMADVDLNAIQPASRKLEQFKLARIHQFAALKARHTLADFLVVRGSPWPFIAPPLIERLPDGRHVLIDGTHRAYAARARGESTVRAIVVINPNYDLPSQPAPTWNDVAILPTKVPRDERYTNFDPTLFRPIRRAFEALAR